MLFYWIEYSKILYKSIISALKKGKPGQLEAQSQPGLWEPHLEKKKKK